MENNEVLYIMGDKMTKEEKAIYQKQYYQSHKAQCLEYQIKYRKENKEMMKEKGKRYYLIHKDKCLKRQVEYAEKNKSLIALYLHKYYQEHKEYAKAYRKGYYASHREEIATKDKGYRERNIEKTKARNKIDSKRKTILRKTDAKVALSCRISRLMNFALKSCVKNKGGESWKRLVGYSIDELKFYIEKKFKKGMTWERFMAGEIHIDHKIPLSVFHYSSKDDIDFKRAWALSNLQPMWATENLKKGARLSNPFQPALKIAA